MNGVIPNLTGASSAPAGRRCCSAASSPTAATRATSCRPFGRGAADRRRRRRDQDWALNDEAIRNLGYMQMKKTHDAAMVLIERIYGERPRFNYYIGTSQGGREGADRRAALSRRLRRHRGQRADRELLVADAGARADSHSGEAARPTG